MSGMILITQEEYDQLQEASIKLACLEGAGVDNWDGYDLAMEMMAESEENSKE